MSVPATPTLPMLPPTHSTPTSAASSSLPTSLEVPRPTPSSLPTSLEVPRPTPSSSISSDPRPKPAPRNRSALRNFYGLSATGEILPELDRPDLNPRKYVDKLLHASGVKELLRRENGLVDDIATLDGERKSLVYDNYSKLIAATATIRRMRESMEPLTPTTSTLEPAVSHIERVSRELVSAAGAAAPAARKEGDEKEVEVVRWAVEAPGRIEVLVREGRKEEAERVWERLRALCEVWEGRKGVQGLKRKGEEAMKAEVGDGRGD